MPLAESRRDPYLDLLRVASVLTVVWTHWLTAKIWAAEDRIGAGSILDDARPLAVTTWIFMVSPVLLFVGGAVNHTLYTASGAQGFLRRRARRLLPPLVAFIGCWVIVDVVLHLLDLGGTGVVRWVGLRGVLPFGPLWFIAVYLALVALTPVTSALIVRFGPVAPIAIAAGTVCVDLARFVLDVPHVGWVNLLLAWLLPHQLGQLYAHAPTRMRSTAVAGTMCAAGLGVLVLLTTTGWYPVGIGGMSGDRFSNMSPPTVCIIALVVWQVGLIVLCRKAGTRLAARPAVAAVVRRVNPLTMTLYLWHMTAMAVAVLALRIVGVGATTRSTIEWWVQRPLWIAVATVCMIGFIGCFAAAGKVMRREPRLAVRSAVAGAPPSG